VAPPPPPPNLSSNSGVSRSAAFAVELTFLNGRKKLSGLDIFSLIQYDK